MRKVTSLFLLLPVAVSFGGCKPPQSAAELAEARQIQTEYLARKQAERANCDAKLNNPAFALFNSRVAIDGQPSLSQMADTTMVGPRERGSLIAWAGIVNECREYQRVIAIWDQTQTHLAALAAGEISFGEYNRRAAELRQASEERTRERMAAAAAEQAAREQAANDAAAARIGDAVDAAIMRAITRRR